MPGGPWACPRFGPSMGFATLTLVDLPVGCFGSGAVHSAGQGEAMKRLNDSSGPGRVGRAEARGIGNPLRVLFVEGCIMSMALGFTGAGCATPSIPFDTTLPAAGAFRIQPRYVRIFTDPGVVEAERNYRHATLDWEIPKGRAAVVCVDCWAWHFSRETQERINEITEKKIAPLLAACRAAGLQVIHAPAEPVASRSPNFVRMRDPAARPQSAWPDSPVWPPAEFRDKAGPFIAYARPAEPQAEVRLRHGQALRDFHPLCRPVGDEPVLADGEDLHRYCARNGILFLFFVGFNTNACVMMRDYGIPAMNARGYETILVRDATTGMESASTMADLTDTRGTIDTIEQFLGYSLTSGELIRSLEASGPR